ncbi:creatininase family protein [Oecophyllibacter saccharovorans]|uniref:Creatininase family protein n=2 Tax=Oecophyllibacter saccharovorans TaxID=2558360 RepID=A0A506UKP6_9PROT|nr:creatininase family protein [Oecophyllibacter saccharovorans]
MRVSNWKKPRNRYAANATLLLLTSGMLLTGALTAQAQSSTPLADTPACSGPGAKVALECRTWTEIDAALKQGMHTVILPVGGTEQSGPYMAVGKHNRRAELLADRIAETLDRQGIATLVAPVIRYVPEGGTSPRTSHMRFAGTLSIPPEVFVRLVEGAAESLKAQGFTTIVLLGDHGGTQGALAQAAQALNRRWRGTRAHVFYVPGYYRVIPGAYADWLKRQGHGAEVGLHAELSDTALMLAADPSLVRQQALAAAPQKPGTAQGVYGGDPRHATAALGQRGLEMQVGEAVQAITAFERAAP